MERKNRTNPVVKVALLPVRGEKIKEEGSRTDDILEGGRRKKAPGMVRGTLPEKNERLKLKKGWEPPKEGKRGASLCLIWGRSFQIDQKGGALEETTKLCGDGAPRFSSYHSRKARGKKSGNGVSSRRENTTRAEKRRVLGSNEKGSVYSLFKERNINRWRKSGQGWLASKKKKRQRPPTTRRRRRVPGEGN